MTINVVKIITRFIVTIKWVSLAIGIFAIALMPLLLTYQLYGLVIPVGLLILLCPMMSGVCWHTQKAIERNLKAGRIEH
jgi:ACR3 family arsenite efflux pump ArsB